MCLAFHCSIHSLKNLIMKVIYAYGGKLGAQEYSKKEISLEIPDINILAGLTICKYFHIAKPFSSLQSYQFQPPLLPTHLQEFHTLFSVSNLNIPSLFPILNWRFQPIQKQLNRSFCKMPHAQALSYALAFDLLLGQTFHFALVPIPILFSGLFSCNYFHSSLTISSLL